MAFVLSSPLNTKPPQQKLHPSTTCRRQRPIPVALATSATLTTSAAFDFQAFTSLLYSEQSRICSSLESLDGEQVFSKDPWGAEDSSGGITRVLQNGAVFEKAGVNVSVVSGTLSEPRANAMRSRGRDCQPGMTYRAAALSLVCHAQSPLVPTLRADVRIFATPGDVWAGGGADLTIFYVNQSQISRFHRHWKFVCDEFDESLYPQFKKQCDGYFYIPCRGEYRGVGGIFYDDLQLPGGDLLGFQKRMLAEFLSSYVPILSENVTLPWTEDQKRWQRIRRGRYLEFNLLQDRGVRFGLEGAKPSRTDAILISAPPSVEWPYAYQPSPGSEEEQTIKLLQGTPVDWASMQDV